MNKLYYTVPIILINSINVIQTKPAESHESIQHKITWIKPVEGTISNPFGNDYKFYNVYRAGHTGIDIKTKVGTSIYSVDKGIVKFIKTKPNMKYGYYIVIEHENGLYTLYAHLQKILVKLNQHVNQGDIIANTGISGLASYPHLHFEVIDRVPIKDGAWGYNYICDKRSQSLINKERNKKVIFDKKFEFDFLPLTTIQEKFSFMNLDKKYIAHFYRMKNKICTEKPIIPITYYNPELLLPSYEHSDMPRFNYKSKKLKHIERIKHSATVIK